MATLTGNEPVSTGMFKAAMSTVVGPVEEDLSELEDRVTFLEDGLARLEDYSWRQLSALSADAQENPTNYSEWIGQTKKAVIDGVEVSCKLIGIAHTTDILTGTEEPAGFTFMCHPNYPKTHNMNASNVTTGGWGATAMRSWLADTVYTGLESVLKPYVKQVSKMYNSANTAISGDTMADSTSDDYLWIPSASEVFGIGSYGNEGAQYQFFAEGGSRVMYPVNSTSANDWWLRSVYSGTYFRIVGSNGSIDSGSASIARGAAVGFCI